jgi:hypothetical protein
VVWIASLPELEGQPVDLTAAVAAALYKDAGWAVQVRLGRLARLDVLAKSTDDLQRDLAIELVQKRLNELIPPNSLRRAIDTIQLSGARRGDAIESDILAEASDLSEIGLVPFWMASRRSALEGKALSSAIDSWRTRKEYRYWEGRIESLRYEAVRQAAITRLRTYDNFMAALEREISGADFLSPAGEPARSPQPAPRLAQ